MYRAYVKCSHPLPFALLCKLCPCTQNNTEKKFELNATTVTTLTHNVLRLKKQIHSSLNKQAAKSLHNLSSHALFFSGTKVCSSTPGPQAGPGSPSPLPAQILMSSLSRSQGRYRTESEETTDQGYKKIYIFGFFSPSVPVTAHINKKQKQRG